MKMILKPFDLIVEKDLLLGSFGTYLVDIMYMAIKNLNNWVYNMKLVFSLN